MIENSRKGYLIFAEVFFCLFVFMKQFYLFPSGFIGIGDVFLVISAIIVFVVQIFIEKETIEFTIVTRNTDITLEVKYIALPCLTMLYILKEVF